MSLEPDPLLGNRSWLDTLVVNIELTLTSIIQGVALSFLCAAANASLSDWRIQDFPYILNGGLLILLFWSRSIGHTLTLIRWPFNFTHNFFYFGSAFLEAVAFGQIGKPVAWFGVLTFFALAVWFLFFLDLRLMFPPTAAHAETKESEFFRIIHRDQRLNILLFIPGFVVFHGLAAWASFAFSSRWPSVPFFFAAVQFVLFMAYLVRFVCMMKQAFTSLARGPGQIG